MYHIPNTFIEIQIPFQEVISALQKGFQSDITTPLRHHHTFNDGIQSNTLLLMPAWQNNQFLGIKIVTVAPLNPQKNLPSIQGTYLLLDAKTGTPLAQLDAKLITNLRTAAASALASTYLSNPQSHTLLMLGTGALAPHLIRAHASVRPIQKVLIWGRNAQKSQLLATKMNSEFEVSVVDDLAKVIPQADIISCATMAKSPILFGEHLRKGQHIDLVGSYQPDMREADNTVIQKSNIYVDTLEGASKESGDILIPIEQGIIQAADIRGDLFDLCNQKISGRASAQDITLFKSVGHALEDLVTAQLIFEKYKKERVS